MAFAGGHVPYADGVLTCRSRPRRRFDASSATVQKALQLLKDEGLAVGRAGAGVTAREHRQQTVRPASYIAPAAPGESYRWITEAEKRGVPAHSTLLDVTDAIPPADVAAALNLAPTETAVLRRQLLSLDGAPAELVASYYPTDLAHGTALTERRKIRGGTRHSLPTWETHRVSALTVSRPASLPRSSARLSNSPATSPYFGHCVSSSPTTSAPSKRP